MSRFDSYREHCGETRKQSRLSVRLVEVCMRHMTQEIKLATHNFLLKMSDRLEAEQISSDDIEDLLETLDYERNINVPPGVNPENLPLWQMIYQNARNLQFHVEYGHIRLRPDQEGALSLLISILSLEIG